MRSAFYILRFALCVISVPLGVLHVVFAKLFGLPRACLLDVFGRYASPYLVRTNLCALRHNSSGSNYCAFAYLGTIKHRGAHAYQCATAHCTGMHSGIVSHRHIVFYHYLPVFALGNVYASAILHIHAIAQFNARYIAAQYSVEPYTALTTNAYVANYICRRGYVAAFAYRGLKPSNAHY